MNSDQRQTRPHQTLAYVRLPCVRVVALVFTLALSALGAAAQGSAQPQQRPTLRLCTGSAQNHYYNVGRIIARAAVKALNVQLVETKGSWENLGRAHASPPQCDALIAQEDAFVIYLKEHPNRVGELERLSSLYSEHIHLICHESMGAELLSELPEQTRVLIGPYGSGTYITWSVMKLINPKTYHKLRDIEAIGGEALLKVSDGAQAQCLLSVNALAQGVVSRAHDQFGAQLKLIEIDDARLLSPIKQPDGLRPLYRPSYIHKNVYPQLLQDHIKTIVVDAVFFLNSDWRKRHPEASAALIKEISTLLPTIRRSVD